MVTKPEHYGDGHSDGLIALEAIDVATTETVDQLLRSYALTAFGGRRVGEAAEVLEEMIRDPQCFVVATVSGAMTVAKQGLLICEMIDRGWIHALVTTGAMMSHGFVEASGRSHFKWDDSWSDTDLYKRGYDRVYDTLELEQNLDDTERIIRGVLNTLDDGTILSSHLILRELGRYLNDSTEADSRSILKSAYLMNVPIYVPAFSDSEMGLDVALLNQARARRGKPRQAYDPFLDLESYARRVSVQERTGIFTIGGGVPRNWAQQLGPFLDIIEKRLGLPGRGFRFRYGVRICPEPVHWGGLSGCTYSEGVSWGKFVPSKDGGRYAEVFADATIVWPLLVRGMLERIGTDTVKKDLKLESSCSQVMATTPTRS